MAANNLCIDWGNSQVKAVIVNDKDQIIEKRIFTEDGADDGIESFIDQFLPTKCIICSVTSNSFNLEQKLKARFDRLVKLDSNTALPIMNAYASPGTLGADRVALAVGAYTYYPNRNNLVICVGTCITYNFVVKNRTFRGGSITPGLRMRLKAMAQFTDKLPEVNLEGELILLGYDTASGMRGGAILGARAEVDGMIQEYESQYPDFNAILTGGDRAFFESKLKSKIFVDPDLLMKGLNVILKYNVPYSR